MSTLWAHLRQLNLAERYFPSRELGRAYAMHAILITAVPLAERGVAYGLATKRGLTPSRRYAQKAGDHKDVERYAREALEIDVLDMQAQEMLLEALTSQGKNDEAKTWRELLAR